MSHTIRGLRSGDEEAIRRLVTDEGWNAGLHDVETFTAADPGAWLLAEVDGTVVGTTLATRWGPAFGWIGLYLVAPAFRGRGIGLDLFGRALDRLAPGGVGLDGDARQQANYRRSGFRDVHGNTRWQGPAAAWRGVSVPDGVALVEASAVPFEDLLALEARGLPAARPALLRAWLDQPDLYARAATRADDLVGFAAARPARLGRKIAPVHATDAGVAEALIAEVVAALPDDSTCWLDVPDPNAASQAMMRAHGMRGVRTSGRMFRGWDGPGPDPSTMFAILAHEVG